MPLTQKCLCETAMSEDVEGQEGRLGGLGV